MKVPLKYRSIFATGLCLLMTLPLLSPLFHVMQEGFHHFERWSHEITGDLQTIEIETAAIRWEKENKELLINGRYFDVKKITYVQDKAILTGYFDEEEDLFQAAYRKHQTPEEAPANAIKQMAVWLSCCQIPVASVLQEPFFTVSETISNIFQQKPFIRTKDGPATPPPRFSFLIIS